MFGITLTGIIAVLVFCAFFVYGIKMGFLRAVFDLLKFFFAGILTWLLYPTVAGFLANTPLYGFIKKTIELTLKDNPALSESLPEFFIKLPAFMKNSVMDTSKQAFDSLVSSTADAMTVLALNVISIILIFILVRIILIFLRKITKALNKIIIIGPINKFLGGIFGCLQGYFFICLAMLIISMFPAGKVYHKVKTDFNTSIVLKAVFSESNDTFGIRARFFKGE